MTDNEETYLWVLEGISISDLGDPEWAWDKEHTMDWETEANAIRDVLDPEMKLVILGDELVRVAKIKSDGSLLAERVKCENFCIPYDAKIFDETEKLISQNGEEYGAEKFKKKVIDMQEGKLPTSKVKNGPSQSFTCETAEE